MKLLANGLVLLTALGCQDATPDAVVDNVVLTHEVLQDKIKGGWAGQVIGVTFGGPTEFRYNGTLIQDYEPIPWYDGYIKKTMEQDPGLYDDVYMDLTFVEVIERLGLDAPADSFAIAFAHADYKLWHANQAARYNILNGIMPPESGHWLNNPHADDIDYQIEADFAGLMSPGMPNAASEISDRVGHIMNYGDGWYGGVYVGAMYSLAFVSDDIHFVVSEALKTIPEQSEFYQCIADVIAWHKVYPNDWKQTWFEIEKKWSSDIGCSKGVFDSFNIDAKTNAAYVVLGLLYGDKDFTKTMEISTRAGQDSDCNPATAGGILGAMMGYDGMPEYWKMGLAEAEDIPFMNTDMSLNNVYAISYKHALSVITKYGGEVNDDEVAIQVQQPETVRFEKSFDGLYPIARNPLRHALEGSKEVSFEGTGIVLNGEALKNNQRLPDYVFEIDVFLNDEKVETVEMSTAFKYRKLEVYWKYQLPKGEHQLRVELKNPHPQYRLQLNDYIVYSDEPPVHHHVE